MRGFYSRLVEAYGPQQWWPAKTPFEVVIGAYLTQKTAWTSVERSIANLAARDLLRVEAIRRLPEAELRELIRPSGYMVRKAAAIKGFVAFLDREYGGSLERLAAEEPDIARERLLELLGVGPETADAILLYALGHPAIVVDEYLRRVVTRHGMLGEKAKYAEIQALGEAAFAGEPYAERAAHCNEFHAVIVELGKRHCRRVPKCEECPLQWDLKLVESRRRVP
ncbi:MAG TPA: base excision DNA repair protein [Acidobacteriaceae bacterium]|nr:base excision DNA repair protein [Acidobacteriaceae bacterium]